jgi:hypothetical protein
MSRTGQCRQLLRFSSSVHSAVPACWARTPSTTSVVTGSSWLSYLSDTGGRRCIASSVAPICSLLASRPSYGTEPQVTVNILSAHISASANPLAARIASRIIAHESVYECSIRNHLVYTRLHDSALQSFLYCAIRLLARGSTSAPCSHLLIQRVACWPGLHQKPFHMTPERPEPICNKTATLSRVDFSLCDRKEMLDCVLVEARQGVWDRDG